MKLAQGSSLLKIAKPILRTIGTSLLFAALQD